MICSEESCSDCKIELFERKWTHILLNWINKCTSSETTAEQLSSKCLLTVINRYKKDICTDDIDRAILCTDDVEPFIKYKYPILRLRYLTEEMKFEKKTYIMTSVLLFYCCCHSKSGEVDDDICRYLTEEEQSIILKFCERLSEMEVTINNVDLAIKEALQYSMKQGKQQKKTEKAKTQRFAPSRYQASFTSDNSTDSKTDSVKFISPITVLPSAVAEGANFTKDDSETTNSEINENIGSKDDEVTNNNETDKVVGLSKDSEITNDSVFNKGDDGDKETRIFRTEKADELGDGSSELSTSCKAECDCARCSVSSCCGAPGSYEEPCPWKRKLKLFKLTRKRLYAFLGGLIMVTLLIIVLSVWAILKRKDEEVTRLTENKKNLDGIFKPNAWECVRGFCHKLNHPTTRTIFKSHSRCVLQCMGPQIWPYPIGYTFFSKDVVALFLQKMEYKFQSLPSESVHRHLAEAFKLFIADLARLEKLGKDGRHAKIDLPLKNINIVIDIETDSDPRLRVNTDESYSLKIDTEFEFIDIHIASASFCGLRHGLETLSQLILLDQLTGTLITLSHITIRDAPSHKYRGLMIDTGRNYIPIPDLLRTIDAMAATKLNTFHWRISDVTSFPLLLPRIKELFENGAYDRTMVYTKADVKAVVLRAKVRGIRVLIEVAAPGPVGRAWSWHNEATCPAKNKNNTCDNTLCLRLNMKESVFDILQMIYAEIIALTEVDDVFHLSDGVFSMLNCFSLIEDRDGFLDKALNRLRLANKGFLPKLPIIWYTKHLMRGFEAKTWEHLGVQLYHYEPDSDYLGKFRVIHSNKWDLSCMMQKQRCHKYRTWQEMYSWTSWRNIEVFTIEGGEAVLWTDLVDSGNLDYHLWPRAAAVAERLWSDIVVNTTATPEVYARLDLHRWRMLLRGFNMQPLWPVWCSLYPGICLEKLN